jgi:hypothetical protein
VAAAGSDPLSGPDSGGLTPFERAQAATGPGFSDAVTFAFADPGSGICGLARLGLTGADRERTGSALAVLFAGATPVGDETGDGSRRASGAAVAPIETVGAVTAGDVPVEPGADFERLDLGDLAATVDEPLRRWTVTFGAGGPRGFELSFEALGAPAELGADEPAARAGGMVGYEQLCRVQGTVRAGGRTHEVRCLGQRGHAWGEPDWDRIEATRTLTAWLEDGTGVTLSAVRPAGAHDHGAEATWAALLAPAGSLRVDEPRLSTTYDEAGLQRRAGLELWVGADDAYPRRASGQAICGSTLELGRLRLDCSFFRWRMEGRSGIGRYDRLRRA